MESPASVPSIFAELPRELIFQQLVPLCDALTQRLMHIVSRECHAHARPYRRDDPSTEALLVAHGSMAQLHAYRDLFTPGNDAFKKVISSGNINAVKAYHEFGLDTRDAWFWARRNISKLTPEIFEFGRARMGFKDTDDLLECAFKTPDDGSYEVPRPRSDIVLPILQSLSASVFENNTALTNELLCKSFWVNGDPATDLALIRLVKDLHFHAYKVSPIQTGIMVMSLIRCNGSLPVLMSLVSEHGPLLTPYHLRQAVEQNRYDILEFLVADRVLKAQLKPPVVCESCPMALAFTRPGRVLVRNIETFDFRVVLWLRQQGVAWDETAFRNYPWKDLRSGDICALLRADCPVALDGRVIARNLVIDSVDDAVFLRERGLPLTDELFLRALQCGRSDAAVDWLFHAAPVGRFEFTTITNARLVWLLGVTRDDPARRKAMLASINACMMTTTHAVSFARIVVAHNIKFNPDVLGSVIINKDYETLGFLLKKPLRSQFRRTIVHLVYNSAQSAFVRRQFEALVDKYYYGKREHILARSFFY